MLKLTCESSQKRDTLQTFKCYHAHTTSDSNVISLKHYRARRLCALWEVPNLLGISCIALEFGTSWVFEFSLHITRSCKTKNWKLVQLQQLFIWKVSALQLFFKHLSISSSVFPCLGSLCPAHHAPGNLENILQRMAILSISCSLI